MRTLRRNSVAVRYTPLVAALACAFAMQDAASATITVVNANDSGTGSLRQAIIDANTNCGLGTDSAPVIQFNLGTGPFVINVSSPLPQFSCASPFTPTIDGRSQSGWSANTLATGFDANIPVVLNGSGLFTSACGLEFFNYGGGSLVVWGLEVRNFNYGGFGTGLCGPIQVYGSRITGNAVGIFASNASQIGDPTNPGRNVIGGNSLYGIEVSYGGSVSIYNNFIGTLDGSTAAGNGKGIYKPGSAGSITGNVVSGNLGIGIYLQGDTGTSVASNMIGTDASGSAGLGNAIGLQADYGSGTGISGNLISGNASGDGVFLFNTTSFLVSGNKIGTNLAGTSALPNGNGIEATCATNVRIYTNVISGNTSNGLMLFGGQGAQLFSNKIGVAGDGVTPMGNGGEGIQVASDTCPTTGNTIYGSTIANNGGNGVLLLAGTGTDIQESSIYANGIKNININNTVGPLPNDPGDTDTGPNNQQNYPVITSVVQSGGNTTIFYTLDSTPSSNFRIDFYTNPGAGAPAGRTYLDNPNISTDASGQFSGSLLKSGLLNNISATATITQTPPVLMPHDTSEFSAIVSVSTSPAVSLSSSSLDFGSVPVGSTSASQMVTVSSVGSAPYQINTFDSSSLCYGGPFCYGGDFTCSTTCSASTPYAPGASCQVSASFHPTFTGFQSTAIYLCDNAAGSPRSITLTGNGVTPPPIVVLPSTFDFGNVLVGTKSAPNTFVFSNPGATDTDIGPVATQGDFALESTNCGTTVPALGACTAVVTFVPTQPGLASGFVYTIPSSPKAAKFTLASVASLFGTGVQFAQLELPSSLDVGAYILGSPPISRTVTLRNSGNATLTFSNISASAPFSVVNNCPVNLAPGESCTIDVRFSATVAGDATGTLTVVSNAQGGSRSIPLTARAQLVATPLVHVAPTFIGYGNRMFGTQSDSQRITLVNDGGAIATLSPLAVSVDYLIVGSTCGLTLASQATCFADVAFRPLGFGPRPGQFTFTSNSANSPHSVDMLGTGCRPFTVSGRGATSACAP